MSLWVGSNDGRAGFRRLNGYEAIHHIGGAGPGQQPAHRPSVISLERDDVAALEE